jgi:hypothetical protein
MLARRLDQLHSSLEALGDRLRRTVAEAVAESMAGWIRDAFLSVLDRLGGRSSGCEPQPRLLPQRRWDEPRRMAERDDQDERAFWPDADGLGYEQEPYDELERFDEPPPAAAQPSSDHLVLSLAAGLQAAAWWLRRAARRRPLLSVAGIALLVGLAVLAAPLLTSSAFRLAASAGQLGALTDAAAFHRSLRPPFGSA